MDTPATDPAVRRWRRNLVRLLLKRGTRIVEKRRKNGKRFNPPRYVRDDPRSDWSVLRHEYRNWRFNQLRYATPTERRLARLHGAHNLAAYKEVCMPANRRAYHLPPAPGRSAESLCRDTPPSPAFRMELVDLSESPSEQDRRAYERRRREMEALCGPGRTGRKQREREAAYQGFGL